MGTPRHELSWLTGALTALAPEPFDEIMRIGSVEFEGDLRAMLRDRGREVPICDGATVLAAESEPPMTTASISGLDLDAQSRSCATYPARLPRSSDRFHPERLLVCLRSTIRSIAPIDLMYSSHGVPSRSAIDLAIEPSRSLF